MKTGSLKLAVLGLLGMVFFVATDPRFGWGDRLDGNAQTNVIDAMHSAWPGTIVGVTGSAAVALIGLWLSTRRTA